MTPVVSPPLPVRWSPAGHSGDLVGVAGVKADHVVASEKWPMGTWGSETYPRCSNVGRSVAIVAASWALSAALDGGLDRLALVCISLVCRASSCRAHHEVCARGVSGREGIVMTWQKQVTPLSSVEL